MRRRWMLIAAGAIVAAAALVGGQLLLNRANVRSPAASSASTTSTAGAVARQPQPMPSRLAPIASTRPAADGAPLHPLRDSPPNVIAGLLLGKLPSGSAYTVRFRPWGYGPSDARGLTVAVTIVSATGLGTAPRADGLRNKTLLLSMDPKNEGVVYGGGTMTGVLTFVAAGDRLVPTLSAVKAPTP